MGRPEYTPLRFSLSGWDAFELRQLRRPAISSGRRKFARCSVNTNYLKLSLVLRISTNTGRSSPWRISTQSKGNDIGMCLLRTCAENPGLYHQKEGAAEYSCFFTCGVWAHRLHSFAECNAFAALWLEPSEKRGPSSFFASFGVRSRRK